MLAPKTRPFTTGSARMLRRLLNLKPRAPHPPAPADVFAALGNLPQFSLARVTLDAPREGA